MTTSRILRTTVAAGCLAALMSGCCVTSIKFRKSQPCPCEAPQTSSELMPIPQGAPPSFESIPVPPPAAQPQIPPAPSPSSAARELGVKTTAMFRSAGDKVKGAFTKLQ